MRTCLGNQTTETKDVLSGGEHPLLSGAFPHESKKMPNPLETFRVTQVAVAGKQTAQDQPIHFLSCSGSTPNLPAPAKIATQVFQARVVKFMCRHLQP